VWQQLLIVLCLLLIIGLLSIIIVSTIATDGRNKRGAYTKSG
jgi:hypothetical protein